jgi:hypothetical protein
LHTPLDELSGAVVWDNGHCAVFLDFIHALTLSADGRADARSHSTQDADLTLDVTCLGPNSLHVRAVVLGWWDPDSTEPGRYARVRELPAEFDTSFTALRDFDAGLKRLLHH